MTTHTVEIGKALQVAVDTTRLNESVMAHVVRIGLRNILMDSHASVKSDDFKDDDEGRKAWRDASLAQAMKKLDAMYKGEVRANATTRVSHADPVEAEAMRMARTFVYGKTKGWEKGDEKAVAYITLAGRAMELPGIEQDDDGQKAADKVKAIIAEAIKRRAARADVREAAAKVVEAAKAVVVTGEDLGL